MTLPTRIWAELTQPDIKAQLETSGQVLFPSGSVEQHSAHLPANIDTLAATLVCDLVAERMDALVLPAPSVGVTPVHMPFEATVTFSHATYQRVVVEICESAAQHGAKDLLIVNWHEGEYPAVGDCCRGIAPAHWSARRDRSHLASLGECRACSGIREARAQRREPRLSPVMPAANLSNVSAHSYRHSRSAQSPNKASAFLEKMALRVCSSTGAAFIQSTPALLSA